MDQSQISPRFWRKEERRREQEAEMKEERERKVRREFLSPGGCRGEKEKRSREPRREVEVPGPSLFERSLPAPYGKT